MTDAPKWVDMIIEIYEPEDTDGSSVGFVFTSKDGSALRPQDILAGLEAWFIQNDELNEADTGYPPPGTVFN